MISFGVSARVALTGLLLATLLAPGAAEGKKKKRKVPSATELLNIFLGPGYSQWLRGPISYLASEDEIAGYLSLQDDDEAAAFIEEFWRLRDPRPETESNPVRDTFVERSKEADKLYSEAAIPGRSTDRGAIFIIYGPPDETHYDISSTTKERMPGRNTDLSVETWTYAKEAEPGLDGLQPERTYRFARQGELTEFFIGRPGTQIQRPNRSPVNR